jgi:hypothetical protein
MPVEYGGKTVFGAAVGILMLETQFPRILGDMGNAESWPFPVHYKVVSGATPDNVVRGDPRIILERFIDAGRELVAMGADGITSTCGFLSLVQDEIKEALDVPVAISSLMQVPMVQALLPSNQKVAIITISASTLSEEHLTAASVSLNTPIFGTDDGDHLTRDILGDAAAIDIEGCRQDMIAVAEKIRGSQPGIGAIVLECTNMVPYASDVRKITGLPVYSIHSFVNWFHAGLRPRRFPLRLDDPRY